MEDAVAHILEIGGDFVIVIAGDFNQLPVDRLTALSLLSIVNKPTHMGHYLDRIYCTQPLYPNVKIISSSIDTKHSMTIARSDSDLIIDVNKQRTMMYFRRHSPAQDHKAIRLLTPVDFTLLIALSMHLSILCYSR